MKKFLSLLCCIPFLFSIAACAPFPSDDGDNDGPPAIVDPEPDPKPDPKPDPEPDPGPIVKEHNYLKDTLFTDGFRLSKLDEGAPDYHTKPLVTENSGVAPAWTIAQWSSKYDLMEGTRASRFGEYTFTYDKTTPAAKSVSVNTKTGDITITLNAEVEYENDRVENQPWPCVLMEQSWYGDELIRIADMQSLTMRMDYKVTKLEDKMHGAVNAGLHCAQAVWYVTLQNRNYDSPDYGKYIWFGILLYDNRLAGTVNDLFAAEDGGKEENTGAFIYQPSSSEWSETGLVPDIKQATEVRFDLLKAARSAYDLAIERNYLGSTKFDDLYIGATNFGFEVTGTYNVSADFSNLGIIWEEKANKPPAQNKG